MDREQEEALQRITARYVAELRAGHHPRLSEYLSRYPHYADAITGFVTYYHAIEATIPEEPDITYPLSQATRAALDEAWKWVLHSESEADTAFTSLQKAANNAGKSFPQLAVEIGLSKDILSMMEQHLIDAATIPYELCHRLASALQQPLAAVVRYLGLAAPEQLAHGIAEAPASYRVNEQPEAAIQTQSFQEAVEQSTHLSNEQKVSWRSILVNEGLLAEGRTLPGNNPKLGRRTVPGSVPWEEGT